MNDGAVILLLLASSLLAASAVGISLVILRRLSALERETTRLRGLMDFSSVEARRARLLSSVSMADESLKRLKGDTKRLSADLSRTFAGIASLLNETHRLEGNPHPKIDMKKLHEINESLLSIGESSLSATRIAENLAKKAEGLTDTIGSLKKSMNRVEPGASDSTGSSGPPR